MKTLLNQPNIDVNRIIDGGTALLMCAAKKGHLEVVNALLGHKNIDVNKKDSDGKTAYELAAEKHQEAIRRAISDFQDPMKRAMQQRPKPVSFNMSTQTDAMTSITDTPPQTIPVPNRRLKKLKEE